MAVIALLQGGRRGFTIHAKGADYNFSVQFSSQKLLGHLHKRDRRCCEGSAKHAATQCNNGWPFDSNLKTLQTRFWPADVIF